MQISTSVRNRSASTDDLAQILPDADFAAAERQRCILETRG
jgi:hypothetical protein